MNVKNVISRSRSYNMSQIKNKNTKPELSLRKSLTIQGLRYRLHATKLPGKPDIVFPSVKLAVFCDGDFWHGKDWEKRKKAGEFKVRRKFWVNKIEGNINRDKKNSEDLKKLGWTVYRVWNSEIIKNSDIVALRIFKIYKLRKLRLTSGQR